MKKEEKGLWDYMEKWQHDFPRERKLEWSKTWLQNAYCKDCRYCCGPQDSCMPYPMALVSSQTRPDLDKDFYLLDATTAYLADKGCKADTPHGCRLEFEKKPIACGLFPIVLVNGGLYLYLHCPAVIYTPLIRFFELARNAAEMLIEMSLEDLRHISICMLPEQLSSKFIDLHIQIFDKAGKNPALR